MESKVGELGIKVSVTPYFLFPHLNRSQPCTTCVDVDRTQNGRNFKHIIAESNEWGISQYCLFIP